MRDFLNLPQERPATRPGTGLRPVDRPTTLPAPGGGRPGGPGAGHRPGNRPGDGIGNRPGHRPGNRPNIGSGNINRGRINAQINNRYNNININNRPFGRDWWGRHPARYPHAFYHPWHHRHYGHGHWWKWATAGAVTGWIAHAWTRPVYYTYGTGGNVYYENNTVYMDGEPYCSADQYYDQASEIATSVPEIDQQQADQVEWMPLGVFAVAKKGVDDTDMLLQLAVSKEGIIAGTLFNETTESSRPVEGTVDKKTQRAAWTFADGKNTDVVMETGIYNLTKDEATVLVHFGAEQTQQWVLVRLDEPKSEASGAPSTSGK